ncbi:MAG: ABC transporter permease [Calditrichaeota bacterium]|nr:ABC transporter permease [Calditrichota bacterium]MCB0269781.1 ABC transporter permease [Calditrichota bacterium]
MTTFFLIKEGFAGFKRAPLAASITIVTVALALTLVGGFALAVQNLADEFERTYRQIRLEAFIDASLNDAQRNGLIQRIKDVAGVATVEYVSPEAALASYRSEFGGDLVEVLGENPLPPSLKIELQSGFSQLSAVEAIVKQINNLPEVDDVVYAENVLRLLNRYFDIGLTIAIILGVVIICIAVVLIYNTIRLTIHSRKTLVEIMQLVGATHSFIKAPFMIEGILQGILGSLFACGILFWVGRFIRDLVFSNLHVPLLYFAGLIICGAVLGLLGSYISVSKYLKI